MKDKPLRCRPVESRRDQKSPLRRCFKLRPPWRFGVRRFCLRLLVAVRERPSCESRERDLRGCPSPSIRFPSLAAVRPLVRMPTDQHAATGTCELGEVHIRTCAPRFKFFLTAGAGFFTGRSEGRRALLSFPFNAGSHRPWQRPRPAPFHRLSRWRSASSRAYIQGASFDYDGYRSPPGSGRAERRFVRHRRAAGFAGVAAGAGTAAAAIRLRRGGAPGSRSRRRTL